MKLLVYAFEPFGRNKQNISQQVLKKLRRRKNVRKVTLPVEFNNSIFVGAVQGTKPSVILGLGQYPRGKKIRIERRGKNQQKTKTQLQRTITKDGQSTAIVTLKLYPDNTSWVSYNAGRSVCNYSIYVLLTDVITKDIPFAFLHIPKNMDIVKATKFVENKIDEILVQ
jgi:pyrrolidone-carboxylate peptidase